MTAASTPVEVTAVGLVKYCAVVATPPRLALVSAMSRPSTSSETVAMPVGGSSRPILSILQPRNSSDCARSLYQCSKLIDLSVWPLVGM